MNKRTVFLNGQWQGGADRETLTGLRELEQYYLSDQNCLKTEVDEGEKLIPENGIIGERVIKRQTAEALRLLEEQGPERLFTVGGGCDADVASIAYMNRKYDGRLFVLWFDAHGDINSPEESDSHLFFGMPLRMLLGDPHFSDTIRRPLTPLQVMHVGGRDLDKPEIRYMAENGIPVFDGSDPEPVLKELRNRAAKRVYIHLDLDVLNPEDFAFTPLPVPGGIRMNRLFDSLQAIHKQFDVVGMGLFEYRAHGEKDERIRRLIKIGTDGAL